MRRITLRYEGECSKCGNELPVSTEAMYERTTGIFCVACEPTDPEDIRAYRQARADRKAGRREQWAESAEKRGQALHEAAHKMASVIPFGQPILVGHHSEKRDQNYRGRIEGKYRRSFEELDKAQMHRDKAANLRRVRVKGDAERRRQAHREANDTKIHKGSRVYDFCFGEGTVKGVYKKSYRIEFDSRAKLGEKYTCSRDKSFVHLVCA